MALARSEVRWSVPIRYVRMMRRKPATTAECNLWFPILAAPASWIAQGGLGWFFGCRVCTSMSVVTADEGV
jgi:hypothetical protein